MLKRASFSLSGPALVFVPLFLLFLFLFLFGLGCARPSAAPAPQDRIEPEPPGLADAAFYKLADEYFDGYFRYNPTQGTTSGFHRYDDQLEDYSGDAIRAQTAFYRKFLERVDGVAAGVGSTLGSEAEADRELLRSNIQAGLLELEEVQSWRKNPDRYSSGVSSSAFAIMSRDFAPAADRLRSLIAREKRMPAVFAAARANLSNPPRIYTEIALEQLPGIVDFFKSDVPEAFKGVLRSRDAAARKLAARFRSANGAVIASLRGYERYLKGKVLAESHGDFRLGADKYRRKLLYEEMVDVPLDRLLEVGYRNLRENQKAFRETAAAIDPSRTPQQILEELVKDHPTGDQLLGKFRNTFGSLVDFIREHHIVTIPSQVLPIVEETPAFMRALTMASMDTPGPYEDKAKEAYFNVTLPEKSWSKARIDEHMEGFNRGTIVSTAVHEAFPGHYIQFLWLQHVPSKVRKLLNGSGSNAEGWAHYCEQMMLDEGYGGGDPKLRLGQLQDALLRNARYIVGIEMHTGKMTYEQAIDFFVTEGYQSRANGERESKRGTSDPTYLVYTLGKLEILKLRDDYRRKLGKDFSLQQFHDAFLKQGVPPLRLIRRALLGPGEEAAAL